MSAYSALLVSFLLADGSSLLLLDLPQRLAATLNFVRSAGTNNTQSTQIHKYDDDARWTDPLKNAPIGTFLWINANRKNEVTKGRV